MNGEKKSFLMLMMLADVHSSTVTGRRKSIPPEAESFSLCQVTK
jgi:hypothetical protein